MIWASINWWTIPQPVDFFGGDVRIVTEFCVFRSFFWHTTTPYLIRSSDNILALTCLQHKKPAEQILVSRGQVDERNNRSGSCRNRKKHQGCTDAIRYVTGGACLPSGDFTTIPLSLGKRSQNRQLGNIYPNCHSTPYGDFRFVLRGQIYFFVFWQYTGVLVGGMFRLWKTYMRQSNWSNSRRSPGRITLILCCGVAVLTVSRAANPVAAKVFNHESRPQKDIYPLRPCGVAIRRQIRIWLGLIV